MGLLVSESGGFMGLRGWKFSGDVGLAGLFIHSGYSFAFRFFSYLSLSRKKREIDR